MASARVETFLFRRALKGWKEKDSLNVKRETVDGKQFPLNYKAITFLMLKQSAMRPVFFFITFLIKSYVRRDK